MVRGGKGGGPGRARTALVRVGLRLAGVEWEDGDEEDGERYAMRAMPWRGWEAYGVAGWLGVYLAAGALWMLGRAVTPGGWTFWVMVPVVLLGVFVAVQVVVVAGVGLGWVVRRLGVGTDEERWVSGVVLVVLTAAAVGMCWAGGVWGWGIGLWWLVPLGMEGVVRMVERAIRE